MRSVYIVQHIYEDEDHEDTKLIGVYATEEKAMMAISRLRTQPGFSRYPDGFHIDNYETGKDHWIEGFG